MKKCVLAYSGGLDTSAIIPWLKENFKVDVIAYCCNVGNLPPIKFLEERAFKLGACDFFYEEAESEFVADFVYPMIRSGATYYDDYLLGTAIARPLIAKKVAEFAKRVQADFIAHGATGKGNDHLRFERAWAYLCPEIKIIAPWKVWSYRGREELVSYLGEKGYYWDDSPKRYSVDVNTFHRSCEGGDLEKIQFPYISSDIHEWLSFNNPRPEKILLKFDQGIATALNGENLLPHELLAALNIKVAKFGIGLCDIVEERVNGIKSRGLYETPGGTVLHSAIKAIKQLCWSRDLYTLSQSMADKYGQIIYDGLWFSDSRQALESYFSKASEMLTGEIQFELSSGSMRILERRSPFSLYRPDIVSFESDFMDIHQASLGHTKIMCLTSLVQGQRERTI